MAMAFLLPVRCLLMIDPLNANQSKVSCSKGYDKSVLRNSHICPIEGNLYDLGWS